MNVTSENRLKISVFEGNGQFGQKFQVEGFVPTNYSSCQKTKINDISCGKRMWAQVSFVLSHCMRLTEKRTEMPWKYRALHYMQSRGKN